MSDTLTITLSDSDLAKVNSNKKDDEDLPRIYDMSSQTYSPISRDMEAFLILEDISFKDTMTDVVKSALSSTQSDLEDSLFEETLKNKKDINSNRIADCNSKLGDYTQVKSDLSSEESDFVNVADISSLFNSINSTQNKLVMIKRLAIYKKVYMSMFESKLKNDSTASEYEKVLKSWLNILTAY